MKAAILIMLLIFTSGVSAFAQTDATSVAGKIGISNLYLNTMKNDLDLGNVPKCFNPTEARNHLNELKSIEEAQALTSEQSCHLLNMETQIYQLLIQKEKTFTGGDAAFADGREDVRIIKENADKHPNCAEALHTYVHSAIVFGNMYSLIRAYVESHLNVQWTDQCKIAEAKMKTLLVLDPKARDELSDETSAKAVNKCLSQ